MTLWEILAIGLVSAIDGLFVGFSFGIKGVKIRGSRMFWLAFWNVPFSAAAICAAIFLGQFITPRQGQVFGGTLLIVAGIVSLVESLRESKPKDGGLSVRAASVIGIWIALDGSMAAFSAGLLGAGIIQTTVIFAIMHVLMLFTGNSMGLLKKQSNEKMQFLPSVLLMLLGIYKLLPI